MFVNLLIYKPRTSPARPLVLQLSEKLCLKSFYFSGQKEDGMTYLPLGPGWGSLLLATATTARPARAIVLQLTEKLDKKACV